MKRSAVTLMDVLATMAIVLVLGSLLAPMFSSSLEGARVSSSLSRLRQMHVAIEAYRMDHGGIDVYESREAHALPPRGYVYGTLLGFPEDFWRSPCGYKDGIESNLRRLSYGYSPSDDPKWSAYLSRYRQNAILLSDPHCNPAGTLWWGKFTSKRGLGLLVGGKLVNVRKRGLPQMEWWAPPPD